MALGPIDPDPLDHGTSHGDPGVIRQVLAAAAHLYPAPPASVIPLLAAGAILGVVGDALLRAPGGPVGLNLSVWIASVAVAAIALHRRAALPLDRARAAWLAIGVLFAAGVTWRDAPPLRLLALGCTTLTFAIAARRLTASWARRAGVLRYAGALAMGALHAWTAAPIALADAMRSTRPVAPDAARWRRAAAVARGLAIAVPLIAVFGALFMSADAVFAELVSKVVRLDFEQILSHVLLFSIMAWLSTGYLRGFLTGTALPWSADRPEETGGQGASAPPRPALGITEVATAMAAVDLLFLAFVIVQFRYLFGADTLVQITPHLTYADYARRGFFELVFAVVLVVPVLLTADWLVGGHRRRDALVFRGLAGAQIALVLAIAASALQRLRLYYASYGLTDSRLYAMVLLLWIGTTLVWLAATVLRGRRDSFAFGALVTGLSTVAALFALNPDALVARANVARMASAAAPVQFDAAYATSLSADAVPFLVETLPRLPSDAQCRIARHLLRRWSPDDDRSLRSWNWATSQASEAVRQHEASLRSMTRPDRPCGP